jgi:chlorobactene glucosyltransferase
MLFYFILFNTVVVVGLVSITFLFYARLPRPETYHFTDEDLPLVSVIIPARNEEANIRRCLESFASQDYTNLEVIVIDDRSTDATSKIVGELAAAHPFIKLLQSTVMPPEGWTGKNNAIVQAVEHATGEWFYFADADTWHFPNAIRNAVCYAKARKAQLVSFWPVHEFGSWGERLITPALWSSFFWLDPFQLVNDYAYDQAYAVGHAILVESTAYQAVGGHQSIHEWIIEDHALAKIMKNKGFHIQMADGSKLVKVLMYTSFDGFWHGWSKMLYAVIQYRRDCLVLVLFFILSSMVMPFIQLATIIGLWIAGGPTNDLMALLPMMAVQFGALLAWRVRIATHFERLGWLFYPLLPFSGLILCACYINSALLVVTGAEVSWKGRKYSVSRLKLPGAN